VSGPYSEAVEDSPGDDLALKPESAQAVGAGSQGNQEKGNNVFTDVLANFVGRCVLRACFASSV